MKKKCLCKDFCNCRKKKKRKCVTKANKYVKKYAAIALLLKSLSEKKRSLVLQHLDEGTIEFLCGLVNNVITEKTALSTRALNRLRTLLEDKKLCFRYVANYKHSTSSKRKKLVQSGRGIGMILTAVAPLLSSVIEKVVDHFRK